MILKAAGLAICGAAMLACNNLDELEQRVDSLESRIQALETQLPQLNENVSALSAILDDGNISSITVDSESGNLVITTTGGTTYELAQGSAGNAPDLSVDEDGYWIIRYAEDEEWQQITGQDGNPVLASSNAIMFGVSDDGYWEISYDGGKTYLPVYREDGQTRIPALEEDSDFFRDIEYIEEEQMLYLTLSDGKVIEVPVVSDFLVQIKNVTYGEAERFTPGQTRTFDVTMRGVEAADVKAPAGWKATLGDVVEETAVLTVTAPATTQTLTKVMADTETDVTILAVFTNGLSSMAKMTVGFSNSPGVEIKEGTHTATSVVFTVTPNQYATSYKYHLYPQATPAPASAEDFASAPEVTDGFSTPLTLTQTTEAQPADIAPVSTYVLYVLPLDTEGTAGTIQSKTATTPDKTYDSLYDSFMDNRPVTIGENTYSRSDFADENIIHIADGEVAATNGNIYFIDEGCTITSIANQNVILIGNSKDAKPKWVMSASKFLSPVSGEQSRLILYNIDIDASGYNSYMFAVNVDFDEGGAFGELVLDNCDISMTKTSPFYSISKARTLDKFVMMNCNVNVPAATSNRFMIHTNTYETEFSKIVYSNNIFYCPDGVASGFRLLSSSVTNNTNATGVTEINVENNTFINTVPSNSAMIIADNIQTATLNSNIFYTAQTVNSNRNMIRCNISGSGAYPATADAATNFAYDTNNAIYNIFYSANYVPASGSVEPVTIIGESPFADIDVANGIYTLSAEYSQYGARRD